MREHKRPWALAPYVRLSGAADPTASCSAPETVRPAPGTQVDDNGKIWGGERKSTNTGGRDLVGLSPFGFGEDHSLLCLFIQISVVLHPGEPFLYFCGIHRLVPNSVLYRFPLLPISDFLTNFDFKTPLSSNSLPTHLSMLFALYSLLPPPFPPQCSLLLLHSVQFVPRHFYSAL